MNKILIAIFAIGSFICSVNCVLGADLSQLFATSFYQCLKSNGYEFAIPRGYCSYGGIDGHIVQNLQNGHSAGLIMDMYMFPCRGKSGTAQVDEMMNGINSGLYGMVWIDVETNPSAGCGWGTNYASNCQFLVEIINRIKSKGKHLGIYATAYMWQSIFGARNACPQAASEQLWYAHYDNSPSFSDFSSFGGWTKPSIKQFAGDVTVCGGGIDKNFYP
jgi:hypothetical protein